eukprot:169650-Pyramimonas_sp.AAC.2
MFSRHTDHWVVPDTLETLSRSKCDETRRLLVSLDEIKPEGFLVETESGRYPGTLGSKSYNLGRMTGVRQFDVPLGLALRTTCLDLHIERLGMLY